MDRKTRGAIARVRGWLVGSRVLTINHVTVLSVLVQVLLSLQSFSFQAIKLLLCIRFPLIDGLLTLIDDCLNSRPLPEGKPDR